MILIPFFRRYDLQKRKCLDMSELSTVFRDLGEHVTQRELEIYFSNFDKNGDGSIDFQEFTLGTLAFIQSHQDQLRRPLPADVELQRLPSYHSEVREGIGEMAPVTLWYPADRCHRYALV